MSAAADSGLLYTALMLRKLHERHGFGRVLDAGADGRYRAVLGEHLPGAVWLDAGQAWAPVVGELRLCRSGDRLGCTDIRPAAAALAGVDLALFGDVFAFLEPEQAQALATAWIRCTPLVLAALPADAPPLPGLAAGFIAGAEVVCLLTADPGRARQVAQLHEVVSGLVRRMTGVSR